MRSPHTFSNPVFIALLTILAAPQASQAADPPKPAAPAAGGSGAKGERMDVEAIRRKYWERGDEEGARVVQNRLYSKASKLEVGAFYASISTDPFLTVRAAGGSLGFHFNESWGANLLYWKHFVSDSSALTTLQQQTNATANLNPPKQYYGAELSYSPVYGKLSLFGEVIVHYDLHLQAGYGMTDTETGKDGTISFGIGQQFFLTKSLTLRLDYRAMRFSETIIDRSGARPPLDRENWTDTFTLGVTAFLF